MRKIATPQRTKELLRQHDLSLKKSLGQNFLIDANILRRLLENIDLDRDTGVIEIGPGIGALTEALAEEAAQVVTIEIDRRLISVLRSLFADTGNVRVIHADVLALDLHDVVTETFSPQQELVVAANLPYYITTPILLKLLHNDIPFRSIVVMVQKEVAARIAAPPGNKAYGSLSVAVQYYARARTVMNVPKTAFLPNPHVDSAVLRLDMRQQPAVNVADETFFFQVVRAAFGQRRKTIFNNLTHHLFPREEKDKVRRCFTSADVDPGRRAETLSIGEFARLTDALVPISRA